MLGLQKEKAFIGDLRQDRNRHLSSNVPPRWLLCLLRLRMEGSEMPCGALAWHRSAEVMVLQWLVLLSKPGATSLELGVQAGVVLELGWMSQALMSKSEGADGQRGSLL